MAQESKYITKSKVSAQQSELAK